MNFFFYNVTAHIGPGFIALKTFAILSNLRNQWGLSEVRRVRLWLSSIQDLLRIQKCLTREPWSCNHSMLAVGVYYRTRNPRKWDRSGVLMLSHDQFVVIIDGLRRLTWENRKFLRLYNPMSTSIDTKVFHGSCGNLPSPCEWIIDHECPDFLLVLVNTPSSNTGEPSEVEKVHIPVSMVPTKIMCHLSYVC